MTDDRFKRKHVDNHPFSIFLQLQIVIQMTEERHGIVLIRAGEKRGTCSTSCDAMLMLMSLVPCHIVSCDTMLMLMSFVPCHIASCDAMLILMSFVPCQKASCDAMLMLMYFDPCHIQ